MSQEGFPIQQPDGLSFSEDLSVYKRDFAHALLKTQGDSFKAALKVFPLDRVKAMRAAHAWPSDRDVIRHKEELLEDLGPESFLPSRSDFLQEMWDVFTSKTTETNDKLKAGELYAKARGFFPKKDPTAGAAEITLVNKVMVVPSSGTDESWEQRTAHQQDTLRAESEASLLTDGS